MPHDLPGEEISQAGRKAGVGVSRSEENGNEFFLGQVSSREFQEALLANREELLSTWNSIIEQDSTTKRTPSC